MYDKDIIVMSSDPYKSTIIGLQNVVCRFIVSLGYEQIKKIWMVLLKVVWKRSPTMLKSDPLFTKRERLDIKKKKKSSDVLLMVGLPKPLLADGTVTYIDTGQHEQEQKPS